MKEIEKRDGLYRLSKKANYRPFYNKYYEEKKPKEESPDTKERRAIHIMINEMIEQGFKKEAIIKALLENFPNSSVKNFFEQYTDYHIQKKGISIGEDEER